MAWFTYFHPEKIASAQERYKNEILRVLGVLEDVLSKQEWLVGGKVTVSDLSFIPYVTCLISHIQKILMTLPQVEQLRYWRPSPGC